MATRKKTKKAQQQPKVLFVQSPLSSRDTLICEISKITQKVFGTDHNANPLYDAGLGAMTRRRIVAQYAVVIEAARAAGWEIVIEKTSPFDDIDI